MDKQTTTILGIGALAVVGYLIYKNQQKPKTFANFSAVMCNGHTDKYENPESPSGMTYVCCNGTTAPDSLGNPCPGSAPRGGGQGGSRPRGGRPRQGGTRPRQTQLGQNF